MGTSRAAALVAMLALASGCFGYNRSAKRWSYVGDTILILAGGAAITGEETTKPGPCTGPTCPTYTSSIGGALVVGVVLVTAGLFGVVLNATRDNVKTAR
jgi:hypothetical protein